MHESAKRPNLNSILNTKCQQTGHFYDHSPLSCKVFNMKMQLTKEKDKTNRFAFFKELTSLVNTSMTL